METFQASQLLTTLLAQAHSFDGLYGILRTIDNAQLNKEDQSRFTSIQEEAIARLPAYLPEKIENQVEPQNDSWYIASVANLVNLANEELAWQFFQQSCKKTNSFFSLLEYAAYLMGVRYQHYPYPWTKFEMEVQLLHDQLKERTRSAFRQQKKALSALQSFYDVSLEEAAVQACSLQWFDLAAEIHHCDINREVSWHILCDLEFDGLLSMNVRDIGHPKRINDPQWALEIIQELERFAHHPDRHFIPLSQHLGWMQNSTLEAEMLERLTKKAPQILSDPTNFCKVAIGLSVSPMKEQYLIQAILMNDSAYTLYEVIDHLQEEELYPQLLEKAQHKCAQQKDYCFAVLDRYAEQRDRKGSLEQLFEAFRQTKNLNAVDEEGDTLLIKSCYYGYNEIVAYLIDLGADMSFCTKKGHTALIAAMSYLNMKFSNFSGTEIEKHLIEKLLHSGVDINSVYREKEGSRTTALSEAACDGYLEIVKQLIELGASYEIEGDKGKAVLTSAIYQYHTEVIRYLLSIGCDATTISAPLPLSHYGQFRDDADFDLMMDILKAAGANVSKSNYIDKV